MSKDKYLSIFSPQMEAIVVIILQTFLETHTVLKIGEYHSIFPSFSWGVFSHLTRLDQSCASGKREYLMDYNGSYTMMAKPAKPMETLKMCYPMTQFLITWNIEVTRI